MRALEAKEYKWNKNINIANATNVKLLRRISYVKFIVDWALVPTKVNYCYQKLCLNIRL